MKHAHGCFDVFSRPEGFPVVAIQAVLGGQPIIAARVSGLPEVVVAAQTGLLVEKKDAKGLAEALCYLVDQPEACAKMGRATRQWAHEFFFVGFVLFSGKLSLAASILYAYSFLVW